VFTRKAGPAKDAAPKRLGAAERLGVRVEPSESLRAGEAARRAKAKAERYVGRLHLRREKEHHPLLAGSAYCALATAAFAAAIVGSADRFLFRCVPSQDGAPAAHLSGVPDAWIGPIFILLVVWHCAAASGWILRMLGYRLSALSIPPAVLIPLAGAATAWGGVKIPPSWTTHLPGEIGAAAAAVLLGALIGALQAKILAAHRS